MNLMLEKRRGSFLEKYQNKQFADLKFQQMQKNKATAKK